MTEEPDTINTTLDNGRSLRQLITGVSLFLAFQAIMVFFFNLNPVWDSIEISLCYFNNFNHSQKDKPISFRMKYVITVMNISVGLTQCGLI